MAEAMLVDDLDEGIVDLDDLDDLGDDEILEFDDIMTTAELNKLIDLKLKEMDEECEEAVTNLNSQVKQQERKQREINKTFSQCQEMIQKYQREMEKEQSLHENEIATVIPSGSDSDDDVQFVEATFEPLLVKSRPGPVQAMAHQSSSPSSVTGKFIPIQPAVPRLPSLIRAPTYVVNQNKLQQVQEGAPIRMNTPPIQGQQFTSPGKQGPQAPVKSPARTAPPPRQIELAIGMKLYGKKRNEIWYKGTLIDIQHKEKPLSERKYKIKFDGKGMKVLSGKNIAYADVPSDHMPVGSRVIALYRDEEANVQTSYYAGIIAEPPNARNANRFLVFFDDGYAQYCSLAELHKVCEQSKNVWDDIHPDSQEFIKGYLQQYPERPMVRLQKGQVVKTEWNGKWWIARVNEVDASLVKMYFDADKRVEWIYRGSTRLEPLYTELKNAEVSKTSGKGRRHNLNMKSNKKPFVEYTRGLDEKQAAAANKPNVQALEEYTIMYQAQAKQVIEMPKKKPVARKSTTKLKETAEMKPKPAGEKPYHQPASLSRSNSGPRDLTPVKEEKAAVEIADDEENGERVPINKLANLTTTRRNFVAHQCNPGCVGSLDDPHKHKGQNPLLIPMLCGWERQVAKQKNTGKRVIFYRSPCARRLRCIEEMDRYLAQTDSRMTIDLFCFDPQLHTDIEYVPVKTFCDIKDLSYGKENVPISCVNGIDRQYPDYVDYSNVRTPAKGVKLNLDPDFLVGCDCTDGCRDRNKCRCIQLTIEASMASPGGKPDFEAGYEHRRLNEPLITGIYECNSRCKCDCRCQNRVAQNGLQLRLQVFKTEKRGWGLRCLDDIPLGGFICVYAGQLLTEQGANEDGQQYGDEYLAELDYIEVVERNKEGYESDVNEDEGFGPDDDYEDSEPCEDQDTDSTYSDHKRKRRTVRGKKKNAPSTPDHAVSKAPAGGQQAIAAWPSRPVQLPQKTGTGTPQATLHKKTQDWVNSLPLHSAPASHDAIIILSESDDDDILPGQTDGAGDEKETEKSSVVKKGEQSVLRSLFHQKGVHLEVDPLRQPIRVPRLSREDAADGMSMDVLLLVTESPTKDDTEKTEEGISSLMITEPVSLNIDDVESDDEEMEPGEIRDPSFNKNKRTTRSQVARFRDLPDPRLQGMGADDQEEEKTKKEERGDKQMVERLRLDSRAYFGTDQYCYVMDAKSMGNLGRYLNHNCSPNVFVQNVFVDTHDLRFPWVAFFACQYIRAGTELTWDYNYEVGSVPGKILYCYCGSAECRGRLL